MAKLTWHGHATIQLDSDQGFVAVVDPWITQNPVHPTKQLPEKVDAILVTHDHFDHVSDAVALSEKTGAKVVGQPEVIARLVKEGLKEERGIGMNIGGTVQIGPLSAHMVHAFHSAENGTPAGYIMTLDNKIIYHLGDTGLFGDLQLFGELHAIDCALIPVGGHYTMDYKLGAVAAKMLKAKKVIPIHYRTFPLLLQDANLFIEEVKRVSPGTEVVVPEVGGTVQL